ncbi:hypothetical protein Tco_1397372 [Tanacetum coccineum]
MSRTVPPIPPPPGTSSGIPASSNVNRVDTMPTTNDPINTTTTTNVSQSVKMDHLFPCQVSLLLKSFAKTSNQWSNAESRLGNQDKRLKSINISFLPNDVMKSVIKCKTAKEMCNDLILAHEGPSDTRDTKIAALRLKLKAFKSLEGEKVNGTFTRLKCLLNVLENNGVIIPQAEVNATFINKWLSMNQTQRANNSIKNDCLATLYGSDSDVEEDQRTNKEFLEDLNAEFHERALLENQNRFYKRSGRVGSARKPIDKSKETYFAYGKTGHFQKDWKGEKGKNQKRKSEKGLIAELFDWDDEHVSSEDEGITKIRAFMAIAEDEPSVGKADARSSQWVDITMKKVHILLSMTDGDDRKHVLDYNHVDLMYVEDKRKNMVNKFNLLKQELSLHKFELCIEKWTCSKVTLDQLLSEQIPGKIIKALGGRGKRKENFSRKEVLFTKADESLSVPIPEITFESESECDSQEHLPPLLKLIGAKPASTPKSLIYLDDLTLNMADLTLDTSVPKKNKSISNKVSPTYVIKKKTKNKLLGIRGFYNLILLVKETTTSED